MMRIKRVFKGYATFLKLRMIFSFLRNDKQEKTIYSPTWGILFEAYLKARGYDIFLTEIFFFTKYYI